MNTFGQGFKFGLISGLYNNMFGGCSMFGFNGYMANPFCNYSFSPMFFTPTFSFNCFTPYNSMNIFNFSYPQNLNPFSLWSSNSYYNNPSVFTPQNQFNYDYFGNLPTSDANNEKAPTNTSTSVSTNTSTPVSTNTSTPVSNTKETVSTTVTTQTNQTESKVETVIQKPVTTKKTKTEEKPSTKPKTKTKKDVKLDYSAENLKAKWKKKKPGLSLEFFEKVVSISKKIKCSPEDLMAVMHSESAGTFNPGEWNHAGSRAVGLIQFTDIAVKSLDPSGKLTLEVLEKMSAIEQLDYVEKYLQYAKCKVAKFDNSHTLTAGELYSIVYLPAVAKKEVLAQREYDPKGYYSKNKIFDSNGDGKITKSEMAGHVIAHRA